MLHLQTRLWRKCSMRSMSHYTWESRTKLPSTCTQTHYIMSKCERICFCSNPVYLLSKLLSSLCVSLLSTTCLHTFNIGYMTLISSTMPMERTPSRCESTSRKRRPRVQNLLKDPWPTSLTDTWLSTDREFIDRMLHTHLKGKIGKQGSRGTVCCRINHPVNSLLLFLKPKTCPG